MKDFKDKVSKNKLASDFEAKDKTQVATQVYAEEDTLVMRVRSSQKNPAALLLLSGFREMIGRSWSLTQDSTSVGRSFQSNHIKINYPRLSKMHFKVLKEEEIFYIIDLKSTNKTFLNEEELEPYKKYQLKNNDYIKAGSLVFKFLGVGNLESFSSNYILNQAQTDTLTRAGNRQLLNTRGADYFLSEKDFSMIVFDVDSFKEINDTFGHQTGDKVLVHLSDKIKQLIRERDLFIRYGGDEFCILSPSSFEEAQSIVNRIKQELKNHPFEWENHKISIRLSIGLAYRLEGDQSWEDVYHRADKLSYEDKKRKKKTKL